MDYKEQNKKLKERGDVLEASNGTMLKRINELDLQKNYWRDKYRKGVLKIDILIKKLNKLN